MKTKLKLSEVRTTYGKNVISESVTLEIPAAEFTAIIGPNACGKSTLLSAIA